MTALSHDTAQAFVVPGPLRPTTVRATPAREAKGQPLWTRLANSSPISGMGTRGFLILVAVLLSASLAMMLALNTLLAKGSFTRYDLMMRKSELVIAEQALAAELTRLESPSALEKKALEFGMVRNPNPAFLDLSTGAVLGTPVPAEAPTPPPATDVDPNAAPVAAPGGVAGGGETALGLRVVETP